MKDKFGRNTTNIRKLNKFALILSFSFETKIAVEVVQITVEDEEIDKVTEEEV